jgi:xylan 1,4-beta-xylosidase
VVEGIACPDDDVPGPEADIQLSLTGLASGVNLQVRSWLVDQHNGDAFSAWKAMGAPARLSKSQVDRLMAASQMAVRRIRLPPRLPDGSVLLVRRLPRQGVELVELTPERSLHGRRRGRPLSWPGL